jgi:hypothetical protein
VSAIIKEERGVSRLLLRQYSGTRVFSSIVTINIYIYRIMDRGINYRECIKVVK